jgi:hypothetical protein
MTNGKIKKKRQKIKLQWIVLVKAMLKNWSLKKKTWIKKKQLLQWIVF